MPKRALSGEEEHSGPSSSVKRVCTEQRKIEERAESNLAAINEQASLSSPVRRKMENLAQEDVDDLEKVYLPHIEAKRRMNAGKLGKPPRSGIIQRIELCQFLCHKYLSIDFEDQLNFIVGQNGSGKSAILAGIAVALGCKASETDRGRGLTHLIRDGQSKAEVTITLKNEGEDAYRSEIYGEKIHISRTISSRGSSTYKIKSSGGKLISNRKAELDTICDHFNIHVENPITILKQGASQKLLKNSTPQYKYKQFFEGTFLNQLQEDYDKAQVDVKNIQELLDSKKDYGKTLQQREELIRQEYKDALDAEDLRARRTRLEHEKAWALANEKELELECAFKNTASSESRLEQLNSELTNAINVFENEGHKIAEVQERHDQIKKVVDDIQKQRSNLQTTTSQRKKEISNLKNDEKTIRLSLKETETQLSHVVSQIKEESEALGQTVQARKEESRQELQALEERIDVMKTSRIPLQDDIVKAKGEVASTDKAYLAKKAEFMQLKQKNEDLTAAYRTFTSQMADPLKQYGNNVQQMLDQINQTQWVGKKPIGPLGMYVGLRDMKYANVMRSFLGSLLCSFVVFHGDDQQALRNIVRGAGNKRTGVLTFTGDLFDYSQGEPPASYLTALRLLDFTDPFVERIFVDFASVERTYAAQTRKEADDILKERPEAKRIAISADCVKVTRWSDGGNKSDPYPDMKVQDYRYNLFRHQTDPAIQKREMEEEGRRLDSEMAIAKNEGLQLLESHKGSLKQLSEFETLAKESDKQIRQAEDALSLRRQEEQDNSPVSLAALETLREECMGSMKSYEEQLAHTIQKKDDLSSELMGIQRSVDSLKRDADSEEEKRAHIQTEIEDMAVARLAAQRNKEHYEGKITEENTKLQNLKAAAETISREFEELRNKASSVGEEEEEGSTRSLRQIEADLSSLNNTLSRYESRIRKPVAQIERELELAKVALHDFAVTWNELAILSNNLTDSLAVRRDQWLKFLAFKSVQCKNEFMKTFSTRGYFGQMIFDHEAGTLELKVQTDADAHDESQQGLAKQKKDPKALSGGEKSLATLCFLLSLWQVCSMPLTCLDEFDVCMDGENRKVAIKMLIDAAKSAGRQTIIITPLSIENIHSQPPTVVIKQMADPRG